MASRQDEYRRLLLRTLIAIAVCTAAVLACYFWIDRSVAFFVYRHDNPSLIGTGAYGFHPFQRGDDVGSFPSGHACRILGFATVWVIAMPQSRMIATVLCAPMLVSLVAMNYHFVSDVIAGSILGAIVATYAAHLARLQMPREDPAWVRAVRLRRGQLT